ncbi:hypothetical protein [Pseudobutyrivibrio xylanivorans]|uniref:hypothetical protein n=1 Tax=Pseudobutyrivibrio xylanivorans TaxID=185007 RepID=UPI001FAAE51E|nr:hypothetical protein [Pseudobutyrivibrio xylanivorans]
MIKKINNTIIDVNGKMLEFDINISQILEYNDFFLLLLRERKEVPNNVIAFDYEGNEIWKINDIVQAKIPRGFDEIEKISDDLLKAHYELGIIFEIDVIKREIVNKTFLR